MPSFTNARAFVLRVPAARPVYGSSAPNGIESHAHRAHARAKSLPALSQLPCNCKWGAQWLTNLRCILKGHFLDALCPIR